MEEYMIRFREAPGSIPGFSRENVNLLETKGGKNYFKNYDHLQRFVIKGIYLRWKVCLQDDKSWNPKNIFSQWMFYIAAFTTKK